MFMFTKCLTLVITLVSTLKQSMNRLVGKSIWLGAMEADGGWCQPGMAENTLVVESSNQSRNPIAIISIVKNG